MDNLKRHQIHFCFFKVLKGNDVVLPHDIVGYKRNNVTAFSSTTNCDLI